MKKLTCLLLFFISVFVACQTQTDSQYQDISVPAFKAKMTEPKTVILDVRTPPEIAEGKIDGALELDFRSPDFAKKLDDLDKENTYLIYCRSGRRSANTCKLMSEKGFKQLYNLDGGFVAWSSEK